MVAEIMELLLVDERPQIAVSDKTETTNMLFSLIISSICG